MSDLPQSWVNAIGQDLFRLVRGVSYDKSAVRSEPGPGLVPVLRATNIEAERLNRTDLVYVPQRFVSAEQMLLQGDMVIASSSGSKSVVGKAAPASSTMTDASFGAFCAVARPRSESLADWLRYYFKTSAYRKFVEDVALGININNLRGRDLEQIDVPLAPTAEQRRIVAKLDALTARTARARADLDRVPAMVRRFKDAAVQSALSGALTARWRRSNSVIDGVPQRATIATPFEYTLSAPSGWAAMPLFDACEIQGGSQPPKSTFTYAPADGYIRFIQIRDYKSDDKMVFIPKALARRFCNETDVMIGRYGPPVFQILRGLSGAYNVALMKAVPRHGISNDFLFWLLKHPTLRRYVELDAKRTAGQDGVNKAHLEKFPVFIPPLEEQAEIVRQIELANGAIDRLAAEAAAARRLLDRLDQSILAKAFRGELVPQDPADEPASVLLDRIRAERGAAPAKPRRGRKAAA